MKKLINILMIVLVICAFGCDQENPQNCSSDDTECNNKTYNGDFNYSTMNMSKLAGYTKINGDLYIKYHVFISLLGLKSLKHVEGDLIIDLNPALLNLDGLQNLETVDGDLRIRLNPALLNIDGLNNLTDVGGNLNVNLNPALLFTNGLDNLKNIGGTRFIQKEIIKSEN